MKRSVSITLVVAASAVLLAGFASGCTKNANLKVQAVDAASIASNAELTSTEKAEQLAKAAEQLFTAQGFSYATTVADLALQHDPNNLRAKLVKAFLGRMMSQKGILARIAPLAAKDPAWQEQYDQLLADAETKYPNSTLKSFLLDGQPDIATESDIQDYFDSLADGFKAIRLFAKANKDQSLTVMTTDSLYHTMQQRLQSACTITEASPFDYRVSCPSPVNSLEITFSRGDFEALQQFAAGYELYLSTLNSYELSGAMAVALEQEAGQNTATSLQIINALSKDPKFATLRAGNGFKKIKELGVDAVSGMRWIMSHQSSLCPFGSATPRNRIGALVNEGLCVDQDNATELAKGMKKADAVLAGKPLQTFIEGANGISYPIMIKPAALMDAPIADLRNLKPTFDPCGHLTSLGDASVGGLFPNSDVNLFMQAPNACEPH